MKTITSAFLLLLFVTSSATATTYDIDPVHSEVAFKVKHLGLSNVRGEFADFSGTFTFDQENIEASSAQASIKTTSVDTSNNKRDDHLRSEDFFHTDEHPLMEFTSKEITDVNGSTFNVIGDLTLNGVTKPVTLEVTHTGNVIDMEGNQRAGFDASTTINRKEFGLTWNKLLEAGGVVVGDEVQVELSLQGIKKK